jgi:hypothetical protein
MTTARRRRIGYAYKEEFMADDKSKAGPAARPGSCGGLLDHARTLDQIAPANLFEVRATIGRRHNELVVQH